MPLSSSLDYVLAADAVAGCQVPWLCVVLGRQSINEDGVQHVVIISGIAVRISAARSAIYPSLQAGCLPVLS